MTFLFVLAWIFVGFVGMFFFRFGPNGGKMPVYQWLAGSFGGVVTALIAIKGLSVLAFDYFYPIFVAILTHEV